MKIDVTYNFQADTAPKDADKYSKILQEYHRILWSKPLPNGKMFELTKISTCRLYHKSDLGEFYLSSDRAVATFTKWKKLKHITTQIPKDRLSQFIETTETIGGIIIWPSTQVDGLPTINASRGFNRKISDRLDLTLECIRRYYLNQDSPLYETFKRYDNFFSLFGDFKGYVDFFLFDENVSKDYSSVKIAPPFNNFETVPVPQSIEEYMEYMEYTENLVNMRNKQISAYFETYGFMVK